MTDRFTAYGSPVWEMQNLLEREPMKPPRLTQEGDPERMTTIWPALVQAYMAYRLSAREA